MYFSFIKTVQLNAIYIQNVAKQKKGDNFN